MQGLKHWGLGAVLMPRQRSELTAPQLRKLLRGWEPDGPHNALDRLSDPDKLTELLENLMLDCSDASASINELQLRQAAKEAWGLEDHKARSFAAKYMSAMHHCRQKAKSMQSGKKLNAAVFKIASVVRGLQSGAGESLLAKSSKLEQAAALGAAALGAAAAAASAAAAEAATLAAAAAEERPSSSRKHRAEASTPSSGSRAQLIQESPLRESVKKKSRKDIYALYGLTAAGSPSPAKRKASELSSPLENKQSEEIDLVTPPRKQVAPRHQVSQASSSGNHAKSTPYWDPVEGQLCRVTSTGGETSEEVKAGPESLC